jgi:cytosine/adenosine deaminase-related metal-dependent hydrolase
MADSSTRTYAARWIFPVTSEPLANGTLTVQGKRIVAVEPHGRRRADIDLGDVAVVPGFVNAHVHLDLTGMRGVCPPSSDFTGWLRQVIQHRIRRSPAQVQADIADGIAESLQFGVVAVGDIAAAGVSWNLLADSPLRAVVFHEMLGLTPERAVQSLQSFDTWHAEHATQIGARVVAGISPHAPYSVHRDLFAAAAKTTLPLATHLAETCDELELLRHRTGPFVDFLKELGVWQPEGLVHDPADIVALHFGRPRTLLVHANHLDPALPDPRCHTVVFCPRTHAAFGHPRHPLPELLRRGVPVALGTDGLASNPDLDLLAEARFVRRHYPEIDGPTLLRMLTLHGAVALGMDGAVGALSAKMEANFVVLPLAKGDNTEPHTRLFDSALPVENVMIRGEWAKPAVA